MKITIERAGKAENLMIEGAGQMEIMPGPFRNFRGGKRKFNDEGKRNFNLKLDIPTEALDELAGMGLNIKEIAPRDEEYGDQPTRFVKVNVAYGGQRPPQLFLVSGKKLKELSQNELALLDAARFTNVDLVIRTYHRDESTTTLYLQKGYFTIEQDPISAKYAELGLDEDDEELPWNNEE